MTMYDGTYRMLYDVKSYAEFALKCAMIGIQLPSNVNEKYFIHCHIDDVKWKIFLFCLIRNMKLPNF